MKVTPNPYKMKRVKRPVLKVSNKMSTSKMETMNSLKRIVSPIKFPNGTAQALIDMDRGE